MSSTRSEGSSARVCPRAIAAQNVFLGGLASGGETSPADAAIMGSMVQLERQNRKEKKKRGKAWANEANGVGKREKVHTLWGMVHG